MATKLMANSDRWADASVMGRDIIDLALPADPDGTLDPLGIDKAWHAYGPSVLEDVNKAKASLIERKGRLRECMTNLGMTLPEAALRHRLQAIKAEIRN